MLYLADNLAYFPYMVQDEPLFIVHHIDVMISVSGTNLLQSFREVLADLTVDRSIDRLRIKMNLFCSGFDRDRRPKNCSGVGKR